MVVMVVIVVGVVVVIVQMGWGKMTLISSYWKIDVDIDVDIDVHVHDDIHDGVFRVTDGKGGRGCVNGLC